MISPQLCSLWSQLEDTNLHAEMAELLVRRYFEEWVLSESAEEREDLHTKAILVDDMLNELANVMELDKSPDNSAL
jgi:hypothetical protein